MKKLLNIGIVLFGLFFLACVHIASNFLLAYPYGTVNVILAVNIFLMAYRQSGLLVWLAFGSFFIIELFSVTPFGIVLFSGTITVLIVYWLMRDLFTNQSVYTICGVTCVAVGISRIFYVILLLLGSVLSGTIVSVRLALFQTVGWEMLFTTLATLALFGIVQATMYVKKHGIPLLWRKQYTP